MTDVNIRAVRLAKENVRRNRITNIDVKWGNLYEPVEGTSFKCVLSNPPVSAGMETVKTIITRAPEKLVQKGRLQMVVRSKIGGKLLPSILEKTFGKYTILARESGYRVLMAEKQ
jgi:16S rRNA G1207 methylase RsmC